MAPVADARCAGRCTNLWGKHRPVDRGKAEIASGIAAGQADGAKANHVDAGGMRGQRGETFTASMPTLAVTRI